MAHSFLQSVSNLFHFLINNEALIMAVQGLLPFLSTWQLALQGLKERSLSAYVYHTSGLGPSHFIRSNNTGVLLFIIIYYYYYYLSQYINDRHVGQMHLLQCYNSNWSNIDLAKAAAFIASIVLVSCGYFIGLKKSIIIIVIIIIMIIPFLGFLSDSTKQAFLLPEDKKLKFAPLRGSLIDSKVISAKSLQRFTGK